MTKQTEDFIKLFHLVSRETGQHDSMIVVFS